MKMSDRTPIEHLEHWRFEQREAQRDEWDEKREHDNDLEQESRRDYESLYNPHDEDEEIFESRWVGENG
jgi:hypothetical protein